jgi:cyclic pyranopterin phosphate synthase
MSKLSHFDDAGQPRMVDVSSKDASRRSATAQAELRIRPEVLAELPANPKGNPLEVARVAGIMAAKRTADLIPMCHPLPLAHAEIQIEEIPTGLRVVASVRTAANTGVEMEALTAASVAALTIYDMTKAMDKAIEIQNVFLLSKSGGKSGDFQRESPIER